MEKLESVEGDKLSTVKKKRATKNKPEPEVTVNFQMVVGEPSGAYRRLCRLLFKKRGQPAETHEAADNGKINKRNKSRNSEK